MVKKKFRHYQDRVLPKNVATRPLLYLYSNLILTKLSSSQLRRVYRNIMLHVYHFMLYYIISFYAIKNIFFCRDHTGEASTTPGPGRDLVLDLG